MPEGCVSGVEFKSVGRIGSYGHDKCKISYSPQSTAHSSVLRRTRAHTASDSAESEHKFSQSYRIRLRELSDTTERTCRGIISNCTYIASFKLYHIDLDSLADKI